MIHLAILGKNTTLCGMYSLRRTLNLQRVDCKNCLEIHQLNEQLLLEAEQDRE